MNIRMSKEAAEAIKKVVGLDNLSHALEMVVTITYFSDPFTQHAPPSKCQFTENRQPYKITFSPEGTAKLFTLGRFYGEPSPAETIKLALYMYLVERVSIKSIPDMIVKDRG